MNNDYITHYGVLGMRWGVRRTKEQLRRASGKSKDQNDDDNGKSSSKGGFLARRKASSEEKISRKGSKKQDSEKPSIEANKPEPKRYNSIKEVPDAELRAAISRLQMEKQYRDLIRELTPKEKKKASDTVKSILAESGKKVVGEATTFLMRQAVNKALGANLGGDKKKK